MKRTLFFVATFCTLLMACQNAKQPDMGIEAFFGEEIETTGAITFDNLLTKMGETDSLPSLVVGKVDKVCQTKGCWMTIIQDDPSQAKELFVQFEDYGFFMPKDISGRTVVMDGYAYREVTTVDELKHYAEDEGQSQEEIDAISEPVEELKFLASGVALLKAEGETEKK